jgi:hypothetical protein
MNDARPLSALLHTIFVLTLRYPFEAADLLLAEEIWSGLGQDAPGSVWGNPPDESAPVDPIPSWVVEAFPLLQHNRSPMACALREWIEVDRGAPEFYQNMFRLRIDHGNSAVVFPMTDLAGRIFTLRKRVLRTKHIWTVSPKEFGREDVAFPSLRQSGAWFGLHLVDWSRPVMLVEGEFDALRVAALGFLNVIASATSNVTHAQIASLMAGDNFLHGYDADDAGRKAHAFLRKQLPAATHRTIDWSAVGRKDGGELQSREELEEVIRLAK